MDVGLRPLTLTCRAVLALAACKPATPPQPAPLAAPIPSPMPPAR